MSEDRSESDAGRERPPATGVGDDDAVTGEVRVVLVTAPNAETGAFLARELVEERLAACGNVIPGLVSVYWWKDEVERDDEVLVILKTSRSRSPALTERIRALHPYEVPEVLVLPVTGGSADYARWVLQECEATVED